MKGYLEKCMVDCDGLICGWCAGMSDEEIFAYCENHQCRVAYYDTTTSIIMM